VIDDQERVEETIDVGKQIRLLREQRNLSQKALAKSSGISRNTLSLIERGHTSPTVSTLKSLARALAVDINAFFRPFDETIIVFTKAGRRPRLQLDHGILNDLGVGMLEPLITPLLLQLDPGARSGDALSHDGQDFIYCLSGQLLYSVNGRSYVLEEGDSLLFDGNLPHRFGNIGSEVAEFIIILSTPHDGAQYIASHFPEES
jgi:transcriptional regulator with XRE-family HTH domain